jgi:hypothetical protein
LLERSGDRSSMVLVLTDYGRNGVSLDDRTRERGWDEGVTSRESEGDARCHLKLHASSKSFGLMGSFANQDF